MDQPERSPLRDVGAITLFVEDLPATKAFYADALALRCVFEDANSAVFGLGNTVINLLDVAEAPGLIAPAPVAGPDSGARSQLTIGIDDVDAVCRKLQTRGVTLLNGPQDRPWGLRTACFRDPAGHVWEVAQKLPRATG